MNVQLTRSAAKRKGAGWPAKRGQIVNAQHPPGNEHSLVDGYKQNAHSPALRLRTRIFLHRVSSRGLVRVFLMLGLAVSAFQAQPVYADLTVSTLADAAQNPSTPFGCISLRPDQACTLRAAVQAFDRSGGGPHTINLSVPGTYQLSIGPGVEDPRLGADPSVGDLDVTVQLIIQNTSGGTVTIDGGRLDRVFHVQAGKRLDLNNLTVQNGVVALGGGAGVYNNGGTVLLNGVTVQENHTTSFGGGVQNVNGGSLTLFKCQFIHDTSEIAGGGIANSGGNVIVSGSHFQINYVVNSSVNSLGGAIYSLDKLDVLNSSFVNNGLLNTNPPTTAIFRGGALFVGGSATISNSTFSNNSAQAPQFAGTGTGGAIYAIAGANVRINASTIAFNNAKTTGGAIDRADAPNTVVSLANTIVAQNTAEQPFGNCRQPVASAGYNLEADVETAFSCLGGAQTTDQFATDALLVKVPKLDPVSGTYVHELAANSPAIDAGNPQVSNNDPAGASCLSRDQLGVTRPVDGNGDGLTRCDIGAVELVPAIPSPGAPPDENPNPPPPPGP